MQPCARVHANLVHTCMHCCVAARTFQNPNRLIACSLRAAPGERQRLRSRLQGRAGRGRGDARRVPAGGADLSPLTSHFSLLTSHLSPLTSHLLSLAGGAERVGRAVRGRGRRDHTPRAEALQGQRDARHFRPV
eukprot:scaffold62190_cov59-Phaeocystis_antarctica.AAC.4